MNAWIVLVSILVVTGGLLSCERRAPSKTHSEVWTEKDGVPPAIYSSPQLKTQDRLVSVQGETVRFSEQRWGPAVVDRGSLKTIANASGHLIYGKLQYAVSPQEKVPVSVELLESLHAQRFLFLENLKKKSAWFRSHEVLSEPQLTVLFDGTKPRITYAIDLLDFAGGRVQRAWFNPEFHMVKKETVSSGFEAPAWIFPTFQHDRIEEILLKDMLEAPVLKSTRHQTSSQGEPNAFSGNKPWKFGLEDSRFDQVQAFYFLQDGLDFYLNELEFRLPVFIEAQTSMGYPEKLNAAFTYRNQIRFGAGDDKTYRALARDPSVVIHELGHVVVGVLAHLPTQGEGGSLNEAFADFFAASHLGSPKMGTLSYLAGPYTRNLEERLLWTERNGGLYHDSLIVSGTLWEIRSVLGVDRAQRLAMRTLTRLGPADGLKDFETALQAAAEGFLSVAEKESVHLILKERAWPGSL